MSHYIEFLKHIVVVTFTSCLLLHIIIFNCFDHNTPKADFFQPARNTAMIMRLLE